MQDLYPGQGVSLDTMISVLDTMTKEGYWWSIANDPLHTQHGTPHPYLAYRDFSIRNDKTAATEATMAHFQGASWEDCIRWLYHEYRIFTHGLEITS